MKLSRHRKGIGINSVLGLIVGTLIALPAIFVGTSIAVDSFSGSTQVQRDAQEIGGLVETAEKQCEVALGTEGSIDASNYQLKPGAATSLEMREGDDGGQELHAIFPQEDNRGWRLENCNYQMEFDGSLTRSNLYMFTVSSSGQDPPTVSIQGEAQ